MDTSDSDSVDSAPAEVLQVEVEEAILGINRYNPENIPLIETYVRAQCRDGTMDLDANLTLLRLYHLETEPSKPDVVSMILLKALMNLPRSDFVLCKCLLTYNLRREKLVNSIITLGRNIDGCNFHKVWPILEDFQVVKEVVGFQEAIFHFACTTIGETYKRIREKDLLRILGLANACVFDVCLEKYGWERDNEGYVITSSEDNLARSKTVDEGMDLEKVSTVLLLPKLGKTEPEPETTENPEDVISTTQSSCDQRA